MEIVVNLLAVCNAPPIPRVLHFRVEWGSVAALNAGGVRIEASCCGHGKTNDRIDLEDGRILLITDQPL